MYQRKPYRRYGNYRGNRSYGQRRRNHRSSGMHPDSYIAKAQVGEEVSIYSSETKFTDFNISPILQKNIKGKGYEYPTKIQDQAIPEILSGKDILGLANTGSGKTAAFLIPMINKLMHDRSQKCLIVVPTRELAEQIREELYQFTKDTYTYSTLVIGGANMRNQIKSLRKNPQFVIGTPGRLIDLNKKGFLRLESFDNIVLDEVDRMLDMGFIRDIEFIISKVKKEKQSLFFSATMTNTAEKIANNLLKNPVKIQIEKQSPTRNIEQGVVRFDQRDKVEVLHELLIKEEFKKVLIFSRTKHGADKLTYKLRDRGFQIDAIHSNKTQAKRIRTISLFKSGKLKILVATDIASRGLDIDDITHVINYDEPQNYDDYIHRIGRTGRAGKMGNALTFIG